MVIKYTCNVCGNSSKNQNEIYHCQEQGRKTKREILQCIAFKAPLNRNILTGQIIDIAFKRKNHEAIYTVKGIFGLINVTEEDIRDAQTEAA